MEQRHKLTVEANREQFLCVHLKEMGEYLKRSRVQFAEDLRVAVQLDDEYSVHVATEAVRQISKLLERFAADGVNLRLG